MLSSYSLFKFSVQLFPQSLMEASRNAPRKALKTNTTATSSSSVSIWHSSQPLEAHGRRPQRSLWKRPQRAKLKQPRKQSTLLQEDSPIPKLSCGEMKGHRRVSTPPPGPDGRVLGKALDEPTGISPRMEFGKPLDAF